MNPLFSLNKDKIGNLIVYLSSKLKTLEHKKLTKLLYLIDEAAIKDRGIPITWLEYKAWKFGPVAPEVYDIKDNEKNCFSNYVVVRKNKNNTNIVIPQSPFDKSDLSDYDLEIANAIIQNFGEKSFDELVEITHQDGSPWAIVMKENEINPNEDTDISLDLTQLISGDESKLAIYNEAEEIIWFRAQMKAC